MTVNEPLKAWGSRFELQGSSEAALHLLVTYASRTLAEV